MDGMTNVEWRRRFRSSFGIRHSAFSMIELLLVVAISLIAAGIAIPLFARSFQGSQLRTSARSVVMAAKYARSMAVLQQKQMAILFDRVKGNLEIISMADRRSMSLRNDFLDGRNTRATDELLATGEAGEEGAAPAAAPIASELVKALGRDVKITGFDSDRADQVLDGIYWVNYYPNGMSDGFEIELTDRDGRRARIEVDSISGSAKVKLE
jgi:prepilin-type N-terminal cleavage/methylation domain-containing protein